MRKSIIVFVILLVCSAFAFANETKYGAELGLGLTPALGFTAEYEVFEFEAEARVIGGHVGLTADVIKHPRHDLDLGFGLGVSKNMLTDLLFAMFSLGQSESIWLCSIDFQAKYSFHFNEHHSIFLGTGIPLCMATLSETRFEPQFLLAEEDGLKLTGSMALLLNTKIGYKYTF